MQIPSLFWSSATQASLTDDDGGAKSGDEKAGAKATTSSTALMNFSKATFVPTGSDKSIDHFDVNFWEKVLGPKVH